MEASSIPAPQSLVLGSRAPGPLLRLRTDEQLVALFREGNEAAFAVIHDRYRQRLFSYARQMLGGSRQDAEDAMQDVFIRAYGALRADARPVSLKAWLYRVAHNRCIDHLRRPVPPAAEIFELSRRPLHDPMEVAERRETLQRLVSDIGHLPEQQRSALLMREIDGMSYTDLAEALDVTVPAVKSLLVRARVGLVEASEARDTQCDEIRTSITLSHGRGVRCTGLVKRHLRDCADCREYKEQMKSLNASLAALNPSTFFGPGSLVGFTQMIGLGGAGTSAAAGGGTVAVTGASGVAVTKVAVAVCCVAVTAGGATEVTHRLTASAKEQAAATAQRSTGAKAAGPTAAAASAPAIARFAPIELPSARQLAGLPATPVGDESAEDGLVQVVADPLTEDAADAISPHVDDSSLVGAAGGVQAPPEPDAEPEMGAAEPTTPGLEKMPQSAEPSAVSVPVAEGVDAPELDDPAAASVAGGAAAPGSR